MVGESGVGKSSLLLRYCDDSFTPSFITTIGIDFKIKTVQVANKIVKLQIWDTAGQERFRTITSAYYRGVMGVVLVYGVDDMKSFNNIEMWIQQIGKQSRSDSVKVLIGNKCDSESRVVSYDEGKHMADRYGMPYIETSAKNNINVDKAFSDLIENVYQNLIIEKEKLVTVPLTPHPKPESFWEKCCN